MTPVSVPETMNELTDGTVGSVGAATGRRAVHIGNRVRLHRRVVRSAATPLGALAPPVSSTVVEHEPSVFIVYGAHLKRPPSTKSGQLY